MVSPTRRHRSKQQAVDDDARDAPTVVAARCFVRHRRFNLRFIDPGRLPPRRNTHANPHSQIRAVRQLAVLGSRLGFVNLQPIWASPDSVVNRFRLDLHALADVHIRVMVPSGFDKGRRPFIAISWD